MIFSGLDGPQRGAGEGAPLKKSEEIRQKFLYILRLWKNCLHILDPKNFNRISPPTLCRIIIIIIAMLSP